MQRILTLSAIVFALVALRSPTLAASPTILVDGAVVQTDVPPMVVDSHVLVPLRGVLERFGADVRYDASAGAVTATRDGVRVRVVVGSTDATIDGKRVALETPARELGGRVEVPLRFLAEALGVSVDFDASSNTVVVVTGQRPGNFVAAGPGTPQFASSSRAVAYTLSSVSNAPPTVDGQRPSPGELVGTQYPQIYARLGGGSAAVDPATVRVTVDGADVTSLSTVSSAYIAYTPSTAMSGGMHTVDVSGQTDDGTPFDSQWSFRIESDMSSGYVSSVIGYSAPAFGYPGFGFSPPGFSLFAPGPQFFFEDEPIVIVFFSPFFPNGTGFFTLSGFPGRFPMTPWLGCPGFFWGSFSVPSGVIDTDAVIAARFMTSDGRTVVVHATAPLHIDGSRRSSPSIRYAVRARLINKPSSPRTMVAFRRMVPARPVVMVRGIAVHTIPMPSRASSARVSPVMRTIPVMRPQPVPVQPVIIPRVVPQPQPVAPQPVVIPQQPAPQPPPPRPVVIPKKPPQ